MNTKLIKTNLQEVVIFKPELFKDKRGYLIESYNEKIYGKCLPNINFVQENESKSCYGVLRGLHFQKKPYQHAKLVRVVKGEIQDVAVDIRPDSKTYGQYVSIILNDQNKRQLYIPKGFAHGFLVLSDEAIVSYKLDGYYNENSYSGIRYDDPFFNIKWNIDNNKIILSDKDSNLPYINE